MPADNACLVQWVSLLPYELLYDCPRQSLVFRIRCAEHHPLGSTAAQQLDKLEFFRTGMYVLFLLLQEKDQKKQPQGALYVLLISALRAGLCPVALRNAPAGAAAIKVARLKNPPDPHRHSLGVP